MSNNVLTLEIVAFLPSHPLLFPYHSINTYTHALAHAHEHIHTHHTPSSLMALALDSPKTISLDVSEAGQAVCFGQ